ncbi:Hint domain-containing protein [Sulfitobacter aestuarii]|uniref:Hint domain-containing protein n=1 Tax=Sulfitobacter aestuarii TaxID=2161676 RepID=A0ABW5TYB3_9RHOB
MPIFYGYTNTIFGHQSSLNGARVDYRYEPTGTWRYSGGTTSFSVREVAPGATQFNGDPQNERIDADRQIGGSGEQTIEIDGIDRQAIWDYTFTVTDGSETWRVAVIDVDLDNDDIIEAGQENGYYLVFPDGMPPADTNLRVSGVVENDSMTPHRELGARVVCFAAGTMIDCADGPRPVETIAQGDLVLTRDGGLQPVVWAAHTIVAAQGDLAPIVIRKGVLGNHADLVVSPQHAILLDDWRAELFFAQEEVLIRAVDLIGHDGVYRRVGGRVSYHHLLLDAHHLLRSEGQWSESLYPGDMTRQNVNPAARREIETLFPDLAAYGPRAAPCLRGYEAKSLGNARA